MSIEAIQAVFDGSPEEEVLSADELQQAIELEPRYERKRDLVLTARDQQNAAEWLIDHTPLSEQACVRANKEAAAYQEVFHRYFEVITGRSATD